jgi:hypothetical protein
MSESDPTPKRARTDSHGSIPDAAEAVPADYEDEISFMQDIESPDDLERHINMSNTEAAQ